MKRKFQHQSAAIARFFLAVVLMGGLLWSCERDTSLSPVDTKIPGVQNPDRELTLDTRNREAQPDFLAKVQEELQHPRWKKRMEKITSGYGNPVWGHYEYVDNAANQSVIVPLVREGDSFVSALLVAGEWKKGKSGKSGIRIGVMDYKRLDRLDTKGKRFKGDPGSTGYATLLARFNQEIFGDVDCRLKKYFIRNTNRSCQLTYVKVEHSCGQVCSPDNSYCGPVQCSYDWIPVWDCDEIDTGNPDTIPMIFRARTPMRNTAREKISMKSYYPI